MSYVDMLPIQDVIDSSSQLMAAGMLAGFGLSLAFWAFGYAVRSLTRYLGGGV